MRSLSAMADNRSDFSSASRSSKNGFQTSASPVLVELILEVSPELPKRHRTRCVKKLLASRSCNSEYHSRLREAMGPRKTSLEHDGSMTAEHAVRVPPACSIHLTLAANDHAKLE